MPMCWLPIALRQRLWEGWLNKINMPKTLEIIAGPNGSGKTTFGETYLADRENIFFINSDKIANGLAPNGGELAIFEAGRFMLQAIKSAFDNQQNFVFETTLSGKIWLNYIKKAKELNYHITIYFVFVESMNLCIERIDHRVKHGGHHIPDEIVKRRFNKSFSNFLNIYKDRVHKWYIIDNTTQPQLIARKTNTNIEIFDEETFNKFFKK